jgi:hypothetical protein
VEAVSPVHAGNISRTFQITVDTPSSYILKAKSERLFEVQTTVEMHRYLAFLKAHDLPVAGIVTTAEGRSIVQEGTTLYELQEYIEHEGNLDDCEYGEVSHQLFSLLGRYHRLSRTYPHSFAKVAYLGDSTLPIGFYAKYFGGALEYAIPRGIRSASAERQVLGQALLALLHFFEDKLRAIQAEMEQHVDKLPEVINHNDIYGNNLLFRDGRLVGLVDFDFCTSEVYYLDLVEALHYSVLLRASEAKYFGIPADGHIRTRNGIDDLSAYFLWNGGFSYDGKLLAQLLMAKVMSLALFPPCELYEQAEERLEMYRRVRRTVENLEDIGAFEL